MLHHWIFRLPGWFSRFMMVQEAIHGISQFLRGRVSGLGFNYMWTLMVELSSSRLPGILSSTCNTLLWQPICHSNSFKSSLPRTYQTHRDRLPYRARQSKRRPVETSSRFFFNAACGHLHEASHSCYLSRLMFQAGNDEHPFPAWGGVLAEAHSSVRNLLVS